MSYVRKRAGERRDRDGGQPSVSALAVADLMASTASSWFRLDRVDERGAVRAVMVGAACTPLGASASRAEMPHMRSCAWHHPVVMPEPAAKAVSPATAAGLPALHDEGDLVETERSGPSVHRRRLAGSSAVMACARVDPDVGRQVGGQPVLAWSLVKGGSGGGWPGAGRSPRPRPARSSVPGCLMVKIPSSSASNRRRARPAPGPRSRSDRTPWLASDSWDGLWASEHAEAPNRATTSRIASTRAVGSGERGRGWRVIRESSRGRRMVVACRGTAPAAAPRLEGCVRPGPSAPLPLDLRSPPQKVPWPRPFLRDERSRCTSRPSRDCPRCAPTSAGCGIVASSCGTWPGPT